MDVLQIGASSIPIVYLALDLLQRNRTIKKSRQAYDDFRRGINYEDYIREVSHPPRSIGPISYSSKICEIERAHSIVGLVKDDMDNIMKRVLDEGKKIADGKGHYQIELDDAKEATARLEKEINMECEDVAERLAKLLL